MTPLRKDSMVNPSHDTELSPSIIYRELERYHIDTIFDPIASTTDAAGYFKLQDVRVIANDMALYMYVKGKALWENNRFTIPEILANKLIEEKSKLPAPEHYGTLGEKWLTDEHRRWLEHWRKIINEEVDEYIRALAETAVCLVIDYWITEKRFGTRASWTPPGLLSYYIKHVNSSLLDNEESNEMWRMEPSEITDKVIADVLFINPPSLKGYAGLGDREQILESWLRGVSDFPMDRIAGKGTLGYPFDNPADYLAAFKNLLEAANHIPMWAIALSNRQPYTRLEFEELLGSLGREIREIDLTIARKFFSLRAPDTIVIAGR